MINYNSYNSIKIFRIKINQINNKINYKNSKKNM